MFYILSPNSSVVYCSSVIFDWASIDFTYTCLNMHMCSTNLRKCFQLIESWTSVHRKEESKGVGPGGSHVTAEEASASLSALEDKILNQYNFAKVTFVVFFLLLRFYNEFSEVYESFLKYCLHSKNWSPSWCLGTPPLGNAFGPKTVLLCPLQNTTMKLLVKARKWVWD